MLEQLRALIPLAPLHQPHNLAAIDAVTARLPDVPQVACFDTSFHRGQPAVAEVVPLPADIRALGVQRYGFHGLSYEYIASVLPDVAPDVADGRVIVAHLGSGASLCAMKGRKSIDSTLGFTALDGLCMGTRPGALDPGIVLYLFQTLGLSARDVETILYKKSGLLGLSGTSNDMRDLVGRREPESRLAVDYFVYRVVKEIGALTAALGGLDALVFTAGIGENSPEIRRRICEGCAWLGVALDADANLTKQPRISASGQPDSGVGDPHQRRTDDRAAHGSAARADRGPPVGHQGVVMTIASEDRKNATGAASPWHGFRTGLWQSEINVRDFIQQNYTPYDGDESFLAAGDRTHEGALGHARRSCSSRSGRRACSTSRRFPARSPRTRPATSTRRTRSSSVCRPTRRSSARSCRTAASGWW